LSGAFLQLLLNDETMRQQNRLSTAVAAGGEQLERSAVVGQRQRK
jgi:hypothetical protein